MVVAVVDDVDGDDDVDGVVVVVDGVVVDGVVVDGVVVDGVVVDGVVVVVDGVVEVVDGVVDDGLIQLFGRATNPVSRPISKIVPKPAITTPITTYLLTNNPFLVVTPTSLA